MSPERDNFTKSPEISNHRARLEADLQKVIKLRREGLGDTAIAQELGWPTYAVTNRLYPQLDKDPTLRLRAKRSSPDELKAEEKDILELVNEDFTQWEIQMIKGFSKGKVIGLIRRLQQAGKLEREIRGKERLQWRQELN